MTFASDLQKFTEKTGIRMDQVVRKVCLDLTRDLVRLTPVDTGLARSNYFFGTERNTSKDASVNLTNSAAVKQFGGSFMGPHTRSDRDAMAAMKFTTGRSTDKAAFMAAKAMMNSDKSGAPSLARSAQFAATLKAGGVYYITNNLPYILQITQYGTSQQAAPGSLTKLTANWQARLNRIAASV